MSLSISKEISPIDALWTLFKSQPKSIRRAFTERVLINDIQAENMKRRLTVKLSLEEAIKELKETQMSEKELPDARSLFQ